MGWGNLLRGLNPLASINWWLFIRNIPIFVLYNITVAYLFTGYYVRVEIRHDPNPVLHFFEGILYLLGVEVAEL